MESLVMSLNKKSNFAIKFSSIFIIFFLVCVSFSGLLIFENDNVNASVTTHYVGGTGSGNYSTIQAAINKASTGDTVFVYAGTYNENVVINKSISLIGESRINTTIKGNTSKINNASQAILVNVNEVMIKGFRVINSGKRHLSGGIKLHNVRHCTIIGNNASSNGLNGIILMAAKSNIIKDNIISFNNGSGLELRYSSAYNTIINNTITNNCVGYPNEVAGVQLIYYSNDNTFSKNTISNNKKFGIAIYHSDNLVIRQNTISGNQNGIHISSINKGHVIYLNEFTNNTNHVNYENGSSSFCSWNSPIKLSYLYNGVNFTNYMGNYWDDYTGTDSNGDGIGDSAHNLGSEKDSYPLVKPIANYMMIPSTTKVDMVATCSNSTNKTVSLVTQKATLDASITGDFNGSINFTELQLVTITSGPFAGNGFFNGHWTAKIFDRSLKGSWRGMLFNKSGERKIYMKGTLFGGLQGITDGYLIESSGGSGTYDVFNSTSTISYIGEEITFAKLTLNGTMSVSKSVNSTSEIYILQSLFKGNATGYYNKSLSVTLTHIRINNKTHEYYGSGFSIISYVSTWGSGSGWTYDRTISTNLVNLTGFFTPPLWGIVFGILNETGRPRTLSITIIRLDLGSKPVPIVKVDVWGPRRASPGQKIHYFIEIRNYGLKSAYNTEIVLVLSKNVTYISSTGYGTYNNTTHTVTWRFNISAKSRKLLSVKVKIKWGLTLGTRVNCTVFIRDYITNTTLDSDTWSILLTVAVDPNLKYGPDGNVLPGQTLDYRIEFENEGKGIAYGVYFTDTLSEFLDESTLKIGPVYGKSGSIIAPPGIYDPGVRTITWFVGEVGPGAGGYADLSINVRNDAAPGSEILNYGVVYFPSVPEVTRTNGIVSTVVINKNPIANAGTNRVVDTLIEVIFNGSGSYDPDGTIVSYKWDFGDGAMGYGKDVTHTYLDDGDYIVRLSVSDNWAFTSSHEINVKVLNRPPMARFEVESKDVQAKEVVFNAKESLDLDGQIVEYYFDFGDGTNSGWIETSTVSHIYTDANKLHTVELSVKDDDGAVNENLAELKITVNNKPIPKLSVEPLEATTYSDIICRGGLSTDSDGQISYYYFDFGDGSDSGWVTTSEVTHQYTDGTKKYTISLLVKDNQDAVSDVSSETEILIKNRKPVPSLTVEDSDVYVFEEVIFKTSESYDLDGEKLEYYIDFGDGINSGWTTDSEIKHMYTGATHEYSVELSVRDDDSELETTSLLITVTNREPHADAGPDQNVEVDELVNFEGADSNDPDGGVLSFNWDFGDGTISGWSKSAQSTHSYAQVGDYTVTLSVSDGTLTAEDTCIIYVEDVKAKIDSDGDGIPDDIDAFPNDPAASVDSDGDHYPDAWNPGMSKDDSTTGLELDEYPNDPARHESSKSSDGSSEIIYLIIFIIIIIIFVIGIIASLTVKNKNRRFTKPFDSNEHISKVRDRIISGDVSQSPGDSDDKLWTDLKMKYQKGEISEETYKLLEQEKKKFE
jgi:uncharacterized repeat protein (TIGR01451 family)